MAARATSSGTICFGLVSIPVKLYPATRPQGVSFHMLHEQDHGRLKQHYTCSACGEVVGRDATVRGYEHARDQYVVLKPEELEALETRSDRSIEIEEFLPIERVDPLYFEKAQLLGPDKGGQKAYRLLNEAMTTLGQVAIGRFHSRGRQQLVLIRPLARGLVLHGLHYADEVRSFDDIEFGDEVSPRAGELELAQKLIEQLASQRFEPQRYEDEYRRAVLEAVERKVAGQQIVVAPRESREQIVDLVAALKQSLAGKAGATGLERKPARAKGKGGGAKAGGAGAKRKESASR